MRRCVCELFECIFCHIYTENVASVGRYTLERPIFSSRQNMPGVWQGETHALTPGFALTAAAHTCAPGAHALDIAWINLDRRTDKALFMQSMLSSSLGALANTSTAGDYSVGGGLPCITTRRFAALGARCENSDAPCTTADARAPIANSTLATLETPYLKSQPTAKRQGLLGCWLSHLALLQAFADGGPAASPDDLLLILEDDAVVCPQLFTSLPAFLAPLPTSWHAVSLSTWGRFHPDDRLGDNSSRVYRSTRRTIDPRAWRTANPDLSLWAYYVRARPTSCTSPIPFRAHRLCLPAPHKCHMGIRMPQMGTHAVLVQRRTVGRVIAHMLNCGATSPDLCAYKAQGDEASRGEPPFDSYALDVPELLDRTAAASVDSDAGMADHEGGSAEGGSTVTPSRGDERAPSQGMSSPRQGDAPASRLAAVPTAVRYVRDVAGSLGSSGAAVEARGAGMPPRPPSCAAHFRAAS